MELEKRQLFFANKKLLAKKIKIIKQNIYLESSCLRIQRQKR